MWNMSVKRCLTAARTLFVWMQPTDPPDRPKLLVCHDYAGGYIEHSWPEVRCTNAGKRQRGMLDHVHTLTCSHQMLQRCGGDMRSAYRLSHWRCIDTFVYFSHHLVTLPPTGWVKAAHLHGTKVSMYRSADNPSIVASMACAVSQGMQCRQVLGTFITEWDAGKAVCSQLFT